jgi:hypothetical protein
LKQRILFDILGGFHNRPSGVKRGEIVDLEDDVALRYQHMGYCEDVDAAEQTDRQRKERADEAKAAWEAYGKRQLDHVARNRTRQHQTIDAGTGEPLISSTNRRR